MNPTRRQLGLGLAGALALTAVGVPIALVQPWSDAERLLIAALEALFPATTDLPSPADIGAPAAVRAYLAKMPRRTRLEARGLLAVVEGATLPTHGRVFSRLDVAERTAVLARWSASDVMARRMIAHSLKQLCAMGYWQHPATWAHLGYDGPLL